MSLILDGTNGLSDVDGSASTPAIRGTDTNTGIFFPAADTIAFAEGGVEQMRLNSVGDLQINSGYGSVATAYGCRAWVNFNGTGTVAIRGSGNVSSITDNGTGDYTVNFSTALVDTNYSVQALAGYRNSISAIVRQYDSPTQSTTAVRLTCSEGTGALADTPQFNVAIFR